ncbi:MAG: hypothetical protein QM709_01235 [Spongiibacteraceae bacterium]
MVLLSPLTALAELKATYRLQQTKQSLDLYYLDDNHLRANYADQQQLLLKGTDSWLLHRQNGQWFAVDANQAGALLKAARGDEIKVPSDEVQLRDTGRKETVAGYQGRVYTLSAGDQTTEVVLTDHPDILALTNGWRTLAIKLSSSLGAEQSAQLQRLLAKIPRTGVGGLLRQGNDLALVTVEQRSGARDIDFPPNTQVLPTLRIPGF